MTDDEFWQQMERQPDYAAFLDRFDGFKRYRLIPRWDEANRKFESEAAFWSRMERAPEALIGRYGSYPRTSRRRRGAAGMRSMQHSRRAAV
jgi:hypothetical protein